MSDQDKGDDIDLYGDNLLDPELNDDQSRDKDELYGDFSSEDGPPSKRPRLVEPEAETKTVGRDNKAVNLSEDQISALIVEELPEGRVMGVSVQGKMREVMKADTSHPNGIPLKFGNAPEMTKPGSAYVGNLSWWTTDVDLANALTNAGVKDLKAVRFYENRANGQSKGFALVETGSEASARALMGKVKELAIHGQIPIAQLVGRTTLNSFEQLSRKGTEQPAEVSLTNRVGPVTTQGLRPRLNPASGPARRPDSSAARSASGPPRVPLPPPGMPRPWMGPPGMSMPPPFDPMFGGRPPVPGPPIPPPPMGMPQSLMGLPPGVPRPPPANAAHINPAFLMGQRTTMPEPSLPSLGSTSTGMPTASQTHAAMAAVAASAMSRLKAQPPAGPTEEEQQESMKRNHAISTSAILRAMQDANSGDFSGAVDTLKTAISLIKQSITASAESSRALIQSLQECLSGIESQAYTTKSSSRSSRDHSSRRRTPMEDDNDDDYHHSRRSHTRTSASSRHHDAHRDSRHERRRR